MVRWGVSTKPANNKRLAEDLEVWQTKHNDKVRGGLKPCTRNSKHSGHDIRDCQPYSPCHWHPTRKPAASPKSDRKHYFSLRALRSFSETFAKENLDWGPVATSQIKASPPLQCTSGSQLRIHCNHTFQCSPSFKLLAISANLVLPTAWFLFSILVNQIDQYWH